MDGEINCFIYKDEIYLNNPKNALIFSSYNNNTLHGRFLYHVDLSYPITLNTLSTGTLFKEIFAEDCLFGNLEELKISNPEYFI